MLLSNSIVSLPGSKTLRTFDINPRKIPVKGLAPIYRLEFSQLLDFSTDR